MRGEGYCFNQEEWIQSFGRVKKFMHFDCLPSNLITFTFLCSLLNLCLHFFASVLGNDKDKESQPATLLTRLQRWSIFDSDAMPMFFM